MSKLQCPNPACHSFEISISRTNRLLATKAVSWLFIKLNTSQLIIIAVVGGVVGSFLVELLALLMPVLVANAQIISIISLLLLASLVYFFGSLPRQETFTYKCNICNYQWSQPRPNPKHTKLIIKIYETRLNDYRKAKDSAKIGVQLSALSGLYGECYDDWQRAINCAQEAVNLVQSNPSKWYYGYALSSLGWCLIYTGESQKAIPILQESLDIMREFKDWQRQDGLLNSLGLALLYAGHYEQARLHLQESMQFCMKMGASIEHIGWNVAGLAGVAIGQGQPVRAAQLCGAAKHLREISGEIIPLTMHRYFQQIVQTTRTQLDPATFEAAWQEGSNVPIDQLLEYTNQTLEAVG